MEQEMYLELVNGILRALPSQVIRIVLFYQNADREGVILWTAA